MKQNVQKILMKRRKLAKCTNSSRIIIFRKFLHIRFSFITNQEKSVFEIFFLIWVPQLGPSYLYHFNHLLIITELGRHVMFQSPMKITSSSSYSFCFPTDVKFSVFMSFVEKTHILKPNWYNIAFKWIHKFSFDLNLPISFNLNLTNFPASSIIFHTTHINPF